MDAYPYIFNSLKTIQAIGVLLKTKDNNKHSYYEIIETLYKADLKSIRDTGYPIMRAKYWTPDSDYASWEGFIQPVDDKPPTETELELVHDPGYGELSPYEMELLHEVFKEVSNG